MKKLILNPSKGHIQILIIILLFVVITFSYFPQMLTGKILDAHDLQTWAGMKKELDDHRAKTGDEALWTNSMFGGMPAYLISANYPTQITLSILNAIYAIPFPANLFIVNFALFFLLGLVFGVTRWVSFAGSLAYGFTSFAFVLIHAGHASKFQTLTFVSLLVAGIYLAYNNRQFVGSLLTLIGFALLINSNHLQMTYYAGIMTMIMVITYFIFAYKEKAVRSFIKTSAMLVVAAIIAVGVNFSLLYTTYEYGNYSTRGKSDITVANSNQTTGLDRDYILDYSYDAGEAVTAFIPRFKGGGMSEPLGENSSVFKLIEKNQGKEKAKTFSQSLPLYWGSQPIASGPFYFGAVLCFLFVLGLFVVKGKEKWWVVAVVLVSFLLSLGKNVPFLANLMIDYFPGYSKFRDVKNIIVIQQFAMAVLGMLAIKEVYLRNIDPKKFINALKYTFAITGGFAFIFVLFPGLAGSFQGSTDAQLAQSGWPQQFIDALIADRKMVLRSDAFRTFVFVALAAAGLWAFWTKKLKAQYALVLWVVLILADLWPVNKKYLNDDSFVAKRKAESPYNQTKADEIILKDKDPNYRVLNLGVSTFNDTSTSYFHKSLGGYHGAKMKRYQEMIEQNITRDMQEIGTRLKNIKTQEDVDAAFAGLNSINMLNTRYIIYNTEAAPLTNPHALGNAWFVSDYMMVANANEEIAAIKNIKAEAKAVVDRQFEKELSGKTFRADALAKIELKSYSPNRLVYQSNCASEQLAVFSEIYYPKGWIAKVDGKETSHFRANYILRSMVVPAGSHEIVFEFKPQSYKIGNAVSLASSILLMIAIGGAAFFEYKKKQKA
jgi:MFS family permease